MHHNERFQFFEKMINILRSMSVRRYSILRHPRSIYATEMIHSPFAMPTVVKVLTNAEIPKVHCVSYFTM